jgi:hypothetical protein
MHRSAEGRLLPAGRKNAQCTIWQTICVPKYLEVSRKMYKFADKYKNMRTEIAMNKKKNNSFSYFSLLDSFYFSIFAPSNQTNEIIIFKIRFP